MGPGSPDLVRPREFVECRVSCLAHLLDGDLPELRVLVEPGLGQAGVGPEVDRAFAGHGAGDLADGLLRKLVHHPGAFLVDQGREAVELLNVEPAGPGDAEDGDQEEEEDHLESQAESLGNGGFSPAFFLFRFL